MSVKRVVVCDECGRVKGDANHWILFSAMPEPTEDAPVPYAIFSVWNDKLAKVHGHLCSEECAVKVLCRTIRPHPVAAAKDEAQP